MTSLHHLGAMSQEFHSLPVLVSFPATITNCSNNSNLRKKALLQLTVQSYSPALSGNPQRQGLEAGSDITPKVKEQRTTHRCKLASAQQPFSVCAVRDSTQGMACLHTPINISKTIPHRQAQRCLPGDSRLCRINNICCHSPPKSVPNALACSRHFSLKARNKAHAPLRMPTDLKNNSSEPPISVLLRGSWQWGFCKFWPALDRLHVRGPQRGHRLQSSYSKDCPTESHNGKATHCHLLRQTVLCGMGTGFKGRGQNHGGM